MDDKTCLMRPFYSCGTSHDRHPDHTAWADSVVEKANDRMNSAHPSTGVVYLDSVFAVTPDRGVGDLWRKYNARLDYYANYAHNPDQRSRCIDTMFSLLKGREKEYGFEYAHTMFARGNDLQTKKQYAQAFQYYFDGRTFAQQHLDDCSLTDFSNSLATICFRQYQYIKAVPYLQQAFEESSSCDDNVNFYNGFILPQGILNTLGLCFERSNMPDSAIVYYLRALECINARGKRYPKRIKFINSARGVVEGNLGGVYAAKDQYQQAVKYLKSSIDTNDRTGYAIEDAQTASLKLASLYFKHDRLKEADSILQRLHADLQIGRGKSRENDYVWLNFYLLKWQLSDKAHHITEAYQDLQRYHAYDDSIDHINDDVKYSDLDLAFKEHTQQFNIQLLQKNDELKTSYLIAAVVFLVMFIGIAFFVWTSLRRSKYQVKKLTALNKRLNIAVGALRQSQGDNIRMIKIAAHDLRNPIGAMMSGAELMINDSLRSEQDKAILQLIKKSGENSLALINDLLHVNTQVKEADKEPVDLQALLIYCVELLQHRAEAKKQNIKVTSYPITINASREKLWRVISNLIVNAIKFSPQEAEISILLEKLEKNALISICDQGIGIPPAMKTTIFDIFTAAKRKGTAGEESFGLGLAISKQIVEAHGGKIWFKSEPGQGTIFYVSLPL